MKLKMLVAIAALPMVALATPAQAEKPGDKIAGSYICVFKDEMVSRTLQLSMGAAIFQILLLDLVFSIDSIITAVGMTEHLPIMIIAVLVSVLVMLLAAEPLAKFINDNPTVVMLALGFLIMIGMTLIAEGFGAHVPKGYVYAAMAFSAAIEVLNMLSRRARQKRLPEQA